MGFGEVGGADVVEGVGAKEGEGFLVGAVEAFGGGVGEGGKVGCFFDGEVFVPVDGDLVEAAVAVKAGGIVGAGLAAVAMGCDGEGAGFAGACCVCF